MILELEANALPAARGQGKVTVTGMVEEEELGSAGKTVRRKSMARSSVENVLTVLRRTMEVDPRDFDIHVNFPGGVPADGPSAGVSVATAVYSAIMGVVVDNKVAMTGELSICGLIKPVGGIVAKVEAARQAGAARVLIPAENDHEMEGIEVIPVERLEEVIDRALLKPASLEKRLPPLTAAVLDVLGSGAFAGEASAAKMIGKTL